mgnify:FL=1
MDIQVKTKSVEPKLYSMVFMDNKMNTRFLWTGVAYSYDEATLIAIAKCDQAFPEEQPKANLWKPIIWQAITIKEIFGNIADVKMDGEEQSNKISKNYLMQKIIKEKDNALYDEIKKGFTAGEKKLIESELKR